MSGRERCECSVQTDNGREYECGLLAVLSENDTAAFPETAEWRCEIHASDRALSHVFPGGLPDIYTTDNRLEESL